MNSSRHVKYPLFLSDFSETCIFWLDFGKILKYQISWKSVQRKPSCSMRTDRRRDMTKLVGAFRNFANAPKKVVVVPIRIMRRIRGGDVKLHSFLTSTLDGEWVDNIRLQLSYPRERTRYPTECLGGPQRRSALFCRTGTLSHSCTYWNRNYVDLRSCRKRLQYVDSRRGDGGAHFYVHKPRRLSQGLLSTIYTTVVHSSNLKQFLSISPDKTLRH